MRILFDTNVVLDVLLDREPFSTPAAQLLSKVDSGEIRGYVCATTITTLYYLASKAVAEQTARSEIGKMMKLFEIAPVNRPVLEAALSSNFKDFEDAVVHQSALYVDAQGIVTRDNQGFERASISIYSPTELLGMLMSIHETSSKGH